MKILNILMADIDFGLQFILLIIAAIVTTLLIAMILSFLFSPCIAFAVRRKKHSQKLAENYSIV